MNFQDLFKRMVAPTSIWVKIIPYALVIGLAVTAFWQYTEKVKVKATAANDAVWEKRMDDFEERSEKKIGALYDRSVVLSKNADAASKRQLAETKLALNAISEKALAGEYLTIVDGRCTFTPQFVNTFNTLRNSLPGATK